MSGADLLRQTRFELLRRAEQLPSFEATSHFVSEHGLDWDEIEACAGLLAVMPVRFDGDRFDFDDGEESEPAIVVEVLGEDGETVLDISAWPAASPARVRTLLGRAPMLGLAAAVNPSTYFLERPLCVFRSALDWLRAGGRGCVLLDPRAGARVLRDAPGRIAAEDTAHAVELRAAIESLFEIERIVCPLTNMAA